MSHIQLSQAQGQLISAVYAGGEEALWRIARKGGPTGELAILALEQLTSPDSDLSPIEAVNLVIDSKIH